MPRTTALPCVFVVRKVWGAQPIQAADTAEEERPQQQLVSTACADPDTQRTVAAALEGTFFNIMQVRRCNSLHYYMLTS